MKKCLFTLSVFLLVLIGGTEAQNRNQYTVRGIVFDASTKLPLRNVSVILKNADSNLIVIRATTSAEGQYTLTAKRSNASFIAEASLSGYTTASSTKFYLNNSLEINLDPIYLEKKNSSAVVTPPVTDVTPHQLIENKFHALNILPTEGAYELFYALNPSLENKELIKSNYEIKYPRFPDFNPVRKKFNKRFKKDKRKGEPFISKVNLRESLLHQHPLWKKGLFSFSGTAAALPESTDELLYNGGEVLQNIAGTNEYVSTSGRYKKFVFALWKYSVNGKPVTDGPDVTGKYTVVYYTGRNRGDESAYNRASNATYGYAPMLDARYYIEVYDGDTKKRIQVADGQDVVDPHLAFEQKDIFIQYNISYTKILIRVID